VAGGRDEADSGEQVEFTVYGYVLQARGVDPLADGVVLLAAGVVEFSSLDVDRSSGEEVVAAAVVEVQVSVDDDVDAVEVEALLTQWVEARIEVGDCRVQFREAGVDEHACVGMVDHVPIYGHPGALGEKVGDLDRRHTVMRLAGSFMRGSLVSGRWPR
jgi:hypothetical protein